MQNIQRSPYVDSLLHNVCITQVDVGTYGSKITAAGRGFKGGPGGKSLQSLGMPGAGTSFKFCSVCYKYIHKSLWAL